MGTAIKHPVPDRVKPSFVIFDIWALWRSVRLNKIPVTRTLHKSQLFYAKNSTRKPCCRKETARCQSYSFRFNVRLPNKLNHTKQIVFKSRFECECIWSITVSAEISWCSLWCSMMLWSLHTENTMHFRCIWSRYLNVTDTFWAIIIIGKTYDLMRLILTVSVIELCCLHCTHYKYAYD